MYQPQPEQPVTKPRRKLSRGCLISLIVIPLLLCTLASIGVAVSNKGNANSVTSSPTTRTATNGPTATVAANKTYKVGDTVSVGNTWSVEPTSATIAQPGTYDYVSKAGDVFLEIPVTLKNISATEQTFSSLLSFNLRDTNGQQYNVGIASDAAQSPEGKVEAGSQLTGTLVYEVPSTAKTFQLFFQNDAFSSGQVVWDVNV